MGIMDDKEKRKKIRRYFSKINFGWPVVLLFFGAGSFLVGVNTYYNGEPYIYLGIGLGIWGGLAFLAALSKRASQPSARQIDEWFDEDLKEISRHALRKLDLDNKLLAGKEPLRVIGPILWSRPGIANRDLLWKKGKDDYVRFSVYQVVMLYTAEHLLAAYVCDFNTLKNVMLNEETYEFHYQDIVSVATLETSTSYTLPNNEKLVVAQEFKISVSSGESIDMIIDSAKLFQFTKGNVYYKNEVEKTVQRLRNLLRDKKQPTGPVSSAPAYTAMPSPSVPSASFADASLFATPPEEPIHASPPSGPTGTTLPRAVLDAAQALESPVPASVGRTGTSNAGIDRFCSNCGRHVDETNRFCPSCGKQLKP
jgi:zinc ribbon protein